MKKALLLLSFVHLLAACTNDIEILPNDESQKLIVNALINANKTNNAIFLALSIIRKTKCFDFWERNVLFPKTKRSFFRTPTPSTLPFSA